MGTVDSQSAVDSWTTLVEAYRSVADTVTNAPDDDAYDLVIAIASGTAMYQEASARLASWH